jgi:ABC-2 type transport system ATP-binding protein
VSSHLLSEMSQMADNVVVIGKGKLIADTSIKKLLAGSSSSVFVRASSLGPLEKALTAAGLSFEKEEDGLSVTSTKTDAVGKIAHLADVTVLELTAHQASLEQAFLELTEGGAEYQAGDKKKGKQ